MGFDVNKKVIEDSECKDFVLALINNGIAEETIVEEDCVRIPELNAVVKVRVSDIKHANDKCMVHVYYTIEHPDFDEPVLEGLAGVGKTLKGAAALSVYNFVTIAFCGFRKSITGKYMTDFESEFQGKKHEWHVSDSCAELLNDGNDDPESEILMKYWEVWEVLKKHMPDYVGNKKKYWINVYCAKREDGVTIGEVRINNRPCRELCSIFSKAAQDFPEDGTLKSLKRFYYITQDDSTYEPYPYTREQVEEFTLKTLDILDECVKTEHFNEYQKKAKEAINDENLSTEILAFIPEICARGAYSEVGFADYIGIKRPDTKGMELINMTQITSYYWIEACLANALVSKRLSQDLYMTCVSISSTFRAVGELKKQNPGKDLSQEDLCFAVAVPADYEIK